MPAMDFCLIKENVGFQLFQFPCLWQSSFLPLHSSSNRLLGSALHANTHVALLRVELWVKKSQTLNTKQKEEESSATD